jgi:pimeloyl-ACP methyl ester carboxylesterase
VLRWYRAANPERYRDWQERLIAVTRVRPAMVVWGEQDPYIDSTYADRFGAREIHRFAGSGHWVIAEETDAVAACFDAFFSQP